LDRLKGKVAIVTGSARGLGRAQAVLFAKEGAKVVVADRLEKGGEETVEMIRKAGGEAVFRKTDVSKSDEGKSLVEATVSSYGKVDVMVNDAGVVDPKEGSTVDCEERIFDETIAINLKGIWLGMKYVIPEMIKGGGGSIINIASIAAIRAFFGNPAYAASKGGVVSVSRVAATEFGSKGIRVNCIAPGSVMTPMLVDLWEGTNLREYYTKLTPSGRLSEEEDIAALSLFLASDESSNINGETISVDGGLTARQP